jgi:hypothetical protein
VDGYDFNTLRVLAHEHHERRLREGAMERLAHERPTRAKRRPWTRLTIGFILKPRRHADQPSLEA